MSHPINRDQTDINLDKNNLNEQAQSFTDLEHHWADQEIFELERRGIIQSDKAGLFHPDVKVTTKQFITWIVRSSKTRLVHESACRGSTYLDYATEKGLIEDYDRVNLDNPIERRQVARIVHEALRSEFNEKDEQDWSAAKKLSDLYSCRTCVQHIAQVYVKGIIDVDQPNTFNLVGYMSRAEAAVIILKMLDRKRRIPKADPKRDKPIELDYEQAKDLILNDSKVRIIDVRTNEEHKIGHIDGSICIPLHNLSNNPFTVCDEKDTPIILYCQKGYKSSLAAQILIDAGYRKIYTIPGIDHYRYNLSK